MLIACQSAHFSSSNWSLNLPPFFQKKWSHHSNRNCVCLCLKHNTVSEAHLFVIRRTRAENNHLMLVLLKPHSAPGATWEYDKTTVCSILRVSPKWTLESYCVYLSVFSEHNELSLLALFSITWIPPLRFTVYTHTLTLLVHFSLTNAKTNRDLGTWEARGRTHGALCILHVCVPHAPFLSFSFLPPILNRKMILWPNSFLTNCCQTAMLVCANT